ncbi:heme-binding protein [Kitasatospora sp. NPDC052896]|uniref:heme-binding protein n=1 Tax=Kitasatospora sp. NPDC052896 TaxID=3364061 RepID=UPI0037C6D47C
MTGRSGWRVDCVSGDLLPIRVHSAVLGEISQPGGPVHGIEHSNGGLVTFGGGLPLVDTGGHVVGAIGVPGGTADQDVQVARAGVAAG